MKPKQLIWRDGRATTPFGEYSVRLPRELWECVFAGDFVVYATTKRNAQAAAQADFERRVRECFEENDDNVSLHMDGLTESDLIGGDN